MKQILLIVALIFACSPAVAGNVTISQDGTGGNVIIKNTVSNPIPSVVEDNNVDLTDNFIKVALPTTDMSVSGIKEISTAGEALAFGDLVYYKSDGKLWKAKANAIATVPCIGIAIATISANGSGEIFKAGFIRNDSWSWTAGGMVYLSPGTSGLLTQTKPTAAGHYIQIIGYAVSADVIYFNPDYTYVEI